MAEFWTGIVLFIPGHGGVLDRYILCLSLVMAEFLTVIVISIPGHGGVLDGLFMFINCHGGV